MLDLVKAVGFLRAMVFVKISFIASTEDIDFAVASGSFQRQHKSNDSPTSSVPKANENVFKQIQDGIQPFFKPGTDSLALEALTKVKF